VISGLNQGQIFKMNLLRIQVAIYIIQSVGQKALPEDFQALKADISYINVSIIVFNAFIKGNPVPQLKFLSLTCHNWSR
jgi:hypothetical protein